MEQQQHKCEYMYKDGYVCDKITTLSVNLCYHHFKNSYKKRNELLQKYIDDNNVDGSLPFFIKVNNKNEILTAKINNRNITHIKKPFTYVTLDDSYEEFVINVPDVIQALNKKYVNEDNLVLKAFKKRLIDFLKKTYQKYLYENFYFIKNEYIYLQGPEKGNEMLQRFKTADDIYIELCNGKHNEFDGYIEILQKGIDQLKQEIEELKKEIYKHHCDICLQDCKIVTKFSCCNYSNSICIACLQKVITICDCCDLNYNLKCPFCRSSFL